MGVLHAGVLQHATVCMPEFCSTPRLRTRESTTGKGGQWELQQFSK